MLQEQGRFPARIREQVWLLTCCCPFHSSIPLLLGELCFAVSWKKKAIVLSVGRDWACFVLNELQSMSYWQCFLVLGGWKAGPLIGMLTRQRMWHPDSGDGV